jgi:Rieske Fe-S protein
MGTMTERHEATMTASRRGVLLGAGVLSAGAALTACSGKSESPASPTSQAGPAAPPASAPSAATEVKVADVPVGGGIVVKDAKVVVTQPQAGQFHAFTAVCTHKQCTVATVADGDIDCPCHGSRFSVTDGTVVKGPATQPLAAKTVTVNGDVLTIS